MFKHKSNYAVTYMPRQNTINSYLRRVPMNSIYAVCHLLIVCVSCVHVQRRGLSRAPRSRVKIKMATSGDGSVSSIQLLRRISQTTRSVQRSIDVAVDVNSLQRNISNIEAVHGFPLGEVETTQLRYKGNITCDVISCTFIPWPCHRIMPCTYE